MLFLRIVIQQINNRQVLLHFNGVKGTSVDQGAVEYLTDNPCCESGQLFDFLSVYLMTYFRNL